MSESQIRTLHIKTYSLTRIGGKDKNEVQQNQMCKETEYRRNEI